MPFGKKNDSVAKILWETQKGMQFNFIDEEILPPEQKEILRSVLEANLKFGDLENTDYEEIVDKENLLNRIIEKVQESGGRIVRKFVDSEGGSHGENSKTNYVVMQVNDVVILEPFGQPNNATIIADKNTPDLLKSIKNLGRREAVEKGIIARINHTRDDEKYDYGSDHIIQILDFAQKQPKELLSNLKNLMKTQTSCSLSTITEMLDKEKGEER